MKKLSVLVLFTFSMIPAVKAQQAKPELLKEPANWQFERFSLPPEFAPAIHYTGIEELRFSPGMFKKDSTDYFTYAFAARIDNITAMTQAEIKSYLLSYFKGLCGSTAKERKLVIDTSQITVFIDKKKSILNNDDVYTAMLNVFGVFDDGAPVKLNMEVKEFRDFAVKRVYLIFIASPKLKNDPVWKMLYRIQNDFTIPTQ